MTNTEQKTSENADRVHGRFRWLCPLILVGGISVSLVAAVIYDALSGLDPKKVMRTGVVESLYTSGAVGGANYTYLVVRLDDGERTYLEVPEGTLPRIGGRIVVSERASIAFRTKHRTFVKYSD